MRLERIHWPVLGLACLLPLFSPHVLSGDSAFFLHAAVTGEKLIHPHHLTHNLVLRSFYLLGSSLGLSQFPYFPLRAGMVVMAIAAVLATYAFLRKLPVSPFVAAVAALLLAAGGLFWQFAAQFEAYVPAYAGLALTTALCLRIRDIDNYRIQYARLLLATVAYALTTTLHQASVLAAPALALVVYLGSTNALPAPRKSRITHAVLFLIASGIMSLSCYIIGWRIAAPGMTFMVWMTEYAHWEGMPWGMMSNFSPLGVKQLILSWGASWLNFDPLEFYKGVPGRYKTPVLALALLFAGSTTLLLISAIRRHYAARHILWIIMWLIPVEIFILWWTPFLKNFQALALVPQIAVLAVAADQVWSGNRTRAAANALLLLIALSVLAVNTRYLVIRCMKERLAPEGDLLIAKQFLRADDLFVAEWPFTLNMQSLVGFRNVTDIRTSLNMGRWPDWKTSPALANRRVVVHNSALYLSAIALERAKLQYEDLWGKFIDQLEASAGGADRLRGDIVVTAQGPLVAVFGTDPELPLSRNQLYRSIAAGAEYASVSPRGFEQTFLRRLPPEFITAERQKRVSESFRSGAAARTWQLAFTDPARKPLWHPELDTDRLEVQPGRIAGHSRGVDPVIWTAIQPPRDISVYSRLHITASLALPPEAMSSAPKEQFNFQLFFNFEDEPTINENRSLTIPWKTDGTLHTESVDLTKTMFLSRPRNLVGLRIDPGGLADCTFEIRELRFTADEFTTFTDR